MDILICPVFQKIKMVGVPGKIDWERASKKWLRDVIRLGMRDGKAY